MDGKNVKNVIIDTQNENTYSKKQGAVVLDRLENVGRIGEENFAQHDHGLLLYIETLSFGHHIFLFLKGQLRFAFKLFLLM